MRQAGSKEVDTNRLKRKLMAGELSLISGNHESADMIDFVGSLGLFDGVWIDMQHGPVSVESLPDMSRAADLWGLTSLVRVRAIDHALIGLTIAAGVHGVLVPRVNTKADAELVVDAAKFAPIGHRAASGGRRSYGHSTDEYHRNANDATFVAVMIEDIVAIENLPEILTVPHIDMFFVAHYDLAHSLGLQSDVENPRLVEAYDRAVELIVGAGKVAGAVVKETELQKYLSMGVSCVKVPGWQALFASAARSFAKKVESSRV
ncbi:MAG TPA: aldolase/citrate lyase family protein [Clostridia bacterium]|nr:aldolase/citrate lyase family protein [Clostridia bacterium]